MNISETGSSTLSTEAHETANASSTYTVAQINCQAQTDQKGTSIGNIENDNSSEFKDKSSSTNSGTMKVFAPVITHDVTLPNTTKKVPMVMVPVPDSKTLMGIPISTLSQFKDTHMDSLKDEQQARDLLSWSDGVGTLDGCDLRFKINQLGCLELLDSDDESENNHMSTINNNINNNRSNNSYHRQQTTTNSGSIIRQQQQQQNAISATNQSQASFVESNTQTTVAVATTTATNGVLDKRSKLNFDSAPIRQISPGSSLLKDGPNTRRPKSSSSNASSLTTSSTAAATASLLKKIEQNQNSILLNKLISKQKLEEIKATKVEKWTIKDVKNFVDSIPGCSGCGELFELQQICGKALMCLDQKDLLDSINVNLGPAVKIYHAISLLK